MMSPIDTPGRTTVVVDPEFAALIPPSSEVERHCLEASILRDGCREPITVWAETGVLLDGHTRFAICTGLGLPFEVRRISLSDRNAAMEWILTTQLARRNLSDFQRVELVKKREPLIREGVAKNQGRRSNLPPDLAESGEARETRQLAAEAAGVSRGTYVNAGRVIDQGTPELQDAVRKELVSIDAAAQVATLPHDEQRRVVAAGTVKATAAKMRKQRKAKKQAKVRIVETNSLVEAARHALGVIDLDPLTTLAWRERVRATTSYLEEDGLDLPWSGRVLLRVPLGCVEAVQRVEKLLDEVAARNVSAAVLLATSQTAAPWFQIAASHANAFCFPRGPGVMATARKGMSPHPDDVVFYFGAEIDRFTTAVEKLGAVIVPARHAAVAKREVE